MNSNELVDALEIAKRNRDYFMAQYHSESKKVKKLLDENLTLNEENRVLKAIHKRSLVAYRENQIINFIRENIE